MFNKICNKSMKYFSKHEFLNSLAHAAGGFGLAVVLQEYLRGDVFVHPYVGWALIAFSLIVHAHSCMK